MLSSKRAVSSEFYSEKLKLLRIQSWFSGYHGSLSAPVTRSSVNAESHCANTNDLLKVALRWRKTFAISNLVKKYKTLKSVPVGSVGRVAQAEQIPIFSENLLGLRSRSLSSAKLTEVIKRPQHFEVVETLVAVQEPVDSCSATPRNACVS